MSQHHQPPRPDWVRVRHPAGGVGDEVWELLGRAGLHTVCQSAQCPNLGECFGRGTATFMVMGEVCTRNCRFCAVAGGRPEPLDPEEPRRLAEAARTLGLKYVVVTSVSRDDLPDGGAGHFAAVIRALREELPAAQVEVLVPDFGGSQRAVTRVMAECPTVFNHNLETVARLARSIRPQASYRRSLDVLAAASEMAKAVAATENAAQAAGAAGVSGGAAAEANDDLRTADDAKTADSASGTTARATVIKTGLMAGLGETDEELLTACRDARRAGAQVLTLGQYLAPSPAHVPVDRYVRPDEFAALRARCLEMGYTHVEAGVFVRSSYHAERQFTGE